MALLWGITAAAQPMPIVLTQKLTTAPKTIEAGNNYDIKVVADTANYIDIRTTGTVKELETMRFPDNKLQLRNDGTTLVFSKDFPYTEGIRIHTTSKEINIVAYGSAQINLHSADKGPMELGTLNLAASNMAVIAVEDDVTVDEATLEVQGFGWIRYNKIEGRNVKKHIYGSGRISSNSDGVEESALSLLTMDHNDMPLFTDWNFGASTLTGSPFGGFNTPTNNFIWTNAFEFNYTFRYAFWHKKHWDLSAGFGVKALSGKADNTYLALKTDQVTGATRLIADDAATLFAAEEAANGKILWSSSFSTAYILFPIRLEWRNRTNYKGLNFSLELQPSINIMRKQTYLVRRGIYQDIPQSASTRDEDFGKYLNPFMLGTRLSVGYSNVNFFLESSLTPMFRTKQSADSRSIDHKLYPISFGVCFTL